MEQNQRKLNLMQATGLAGAILILAGAIATALNPAAEYEADLTPGFAVESADATVRSN